MTQPLDWEKLRVFHAVAEAGSFTKAAERLMITQSSASRRIIGLEEEIGAPLFHRHARGLLLTEQGEMLYRTVREMAIRLEMTRATLADVCQRPKGDLRVTTTFSFGSQWLTPRLAEFMDQYPGIRVHLILDDEELDLGMREADIAIRLREPVQNDLVRKKLFAVHCHVYASSAYIKRHGQPQSLDDLDYHPIMSFNAPSNLKELDWLVTAGRGSRSPREPQLVVNSILGLKHAVASGLGLALLPDYIVEPGSDLVRVLPDVSAPTLDAFMVYPQELRNVARVQVFRDFLQEHARKWAY